MPSARIPVFRPILPTADEVLPYLRRIDESRWYANFGPLVGELEERLAEHFGLASDCVVTAANGTLGLMASLATASPRRGRRAPMPAWTFPSTALSALHARLDPFLCDVELQTWMIEGGAVSPSMLEQSGALVPVAPFGVAPPLERWMAWTSESEVPLVVDAAASFDHLAGMGIPAGHSTAVMISLHATKALGIGEGAVVLTNDPAWAARVRQYSNSGFAGARRTDIVGTNAKLSEYSAAVGLAALDGWDEARQHWITVTERFVDNLATVGLRAQPGFGNGYVSPYCVAEFSNRDTCDRAIQLLASDAIETRRWWGFGLHHHPALSHLLHDDLSNTEDIAARTVGLPYWRDIERTVVDRVFETLATAIDESK